MLEHLFYRTPLEGCFLREISIKSTCHPAYSGRRKGRGFSNISNSLKLMPRILPLLSKNSVPFSKEHSIIILTLTCDMAVLYGNDAFSVFVFSTKKRYSSSVYENP